MEKIFDPIEEKIAGFILSHVWLWFGIVILVVLYAIFAFIIASIPQLSTFKSKVIKPIAKKISHKKLVKLAIKSEINENVNRVLNSFKPFLPAGWIKNMDIKWVISESKNEFLDDQEIVVRIRPLNEQEKNFSNATYYFLKKSFFPKTKKVIPEVHREASILYICGIIIDSLKDDKYKRVYEDDILEPAIEKHGRLLEYIDKYKELDSKGYFTGAFLREIQAVADEVRFTLQRSNVGSEASEIIAHIQEFIRCYEEDTLSNNDWFKTGPVSCYGFLLVAMPVKANGRSGVQPYVNRAKERITQGAKRLYVFGAGSQKGFAKHVIKAISQVSDIELVEEFLTPYDYRGEKGGIGALFVKK